MTTRFCATIQAIGVAHHAVPETERRQRKFDRDRVALRPVGMLETSLLLIVPNFRVHDSRQKIVANDPLVMPADETLGPFEQCSWPEVLDPRYGRRIGS